jgi:hypothetical protein
VDLLSNQRLHVNLTLVTSCLHGVDHEIFSIRNILSRVRVIIDGVWIGKWIY